MSQHH
jgi:hypothetical protein